MSETAIRAEHLRFAYPGAEGAPSQTVFEDLDLTVESGSFVAVVGHNGCGKSTFAKLCNAILLPEGGSIAAYGMDTADEALILEIRRRVGMVFQNPDNQLVSNVVEEDVAFAPENLGVDPAEIRVRVDEALKQVGMYDYRQHAPHLLSGGQKQRVAIARTLMKDNDILIFDDSLSAVDTETDAQIRAALKKRSRDSTTLIISHRVVTLSQADLIFVMEDGKITEQGTHDQLIHSGGLYSKIFNIQSALEEEFKEEKNSYAAV